MKLKSVLVASGVAALGAVPAFAQNAIVDWTGFYGGLGVMGGTGEVQPGPTFDLDDNNIGLEGFVGYDHAVGDFVLGGEFGYSTAKFNNTAWPPLSNYSDILDLKVKLGYAAGRWMPYLVVGRSQVTGTGDGASYDSVGYNFGVGVNYAVNDNLFVGGELLDRKMNGNGNSKKYSNTDLDIRTIAVRVAWKF